MDKCETDPAHAARINTAATVELAEACVQAGAALIYVSSCGIFDGNSREPYLETESPRPRTFYARSKFDAEGRVLAASPRNLVCRVGWLFGGSVDQKKNFVEARRKEALKGGTMLSASDKWGSPTYARDAAERIIELFSRGAAGVVHVANVGVASRYEYVREIVVALNLEVEVRPADSSAFRRAAPVPDFEAIASCRDAELGVPAMDDWRSALRRYISETYG